MNDGKSEARQVQFPCHIATILKSGRRKGKAKYSKRRPVWKMIGAGWIIRCTATVSVLARLLLCPTDGWTRSDPVNSEHLKQSQFLVLVYERREKLLMAE